MGKIAQVRGLEEGSPAISPATFTDLATAADFARFADRVREVSGGIPIGIATQKPELRARLDVNEGAQRLERFLGASVELMQVMARACGHDDLAGFELRDLTTWKREMADLSGVPYGGVLPGGAAGSSRGTSMA